eukprot:m.29780 g.29780  ORF g.29780 m.29780 type:complete len:397 (+) comp8134_c0_seq1:214-1404(+)
MEHKMMYMLLLLLLLALHCNTIPDNHWVKEGGVSLDVAYNTSSQWKAWREKFPKDVYMTHIPKSGITSLGADCVGVMPADMKLHTSERRLHDFFGDAISSKSNFVTGAFFRFPRAHVFSQYLECKYDNWGQKVTHNTKFPRTGTDEQGFSKWIDHFLNMKWSKALPASQFNCYNPINMQARYVEDDRKFLQTHYLDSGPLVFNLTYAKDVINSISFVGITDFYIESVCLLRFFTTRKLPPNCDWRNRNISVHHEAHGVPKHSYTTLNETLLLKVDVLSQSDLALYTMVFTRFIKDCIYAGSITGVQLIDPDEVKNMERKIITIKTEDKYFEDNVAANTLAAFKKGVKEMADDIKWATPVPRLATLFQKGQRMNPPIDAEGVVVYNPTIMKAVWDRL